MESLVLLATIAIGVGGALLAARWSLLLIVHNMPQRKRS